MWSTSSGARWYAGAEEHGGDAAITVVGSRSLQGLDLALHSITFRSIRHAHFSSNGDGCDRVLDPQTAMVWAGAVDPCR